mmetsp:Transcript_13735/g.43387  ORF Transcript_13735/g.43387 Transcript_13735/m.43387 type:complete len:427 (-) Transcript_13735:188-1468(-)
MRRALALCCWSGALGLAPTVVEQRPAKSMAVEQGRSSGPAPETMRPRGVEGVYAGSTALVREVPGLCSWEAWYEAPRWLRNGHAHTIWANKMRSAPGVRYGRELLETSDGGTLALDVLEGASTEFVIDKARRFEPTGRPFALLLSGLGGGSQDSYVRSFGAYAASRGFDVAVLNMRACGDSPVTSPRFFSAYRGSTDDVALAVQAIRERFAPPAVVGVGWSNSGTIVINALAAEDVGLDAACALAAPLNMPVSSKNLERWFHRNVYDRSIAASLSSKFRKHRSLFETPDGVPKPIPKWRSAETFLVDADRAAAATSIRAVDDAVTAPCFGFDTVDQYYAFSSSHQRLAAVDKPLLVVNAADDPIALWGDFDRLVADVRANPNLVFAATDHGGHLGWCDKTDPTGQHPAWIQRCALDFLQAALPPSP